jgi:hypothetical protein
LLLLIPQLVFYVLGIGGYVLARNGKSGGRLFSVPFYVLLLGAAGVVGVWDGYRGRKFHIWDVAAQSRGRLSTTRG